MNSYFIFWVDAGIIILVILDVYYRGSLGELVGITEKEDSRHEPLPSVLESTIIMGIAFLMVFGRKSTETSSWSRRPEHKHEHDHSNKNHDSEHSGSGIIEFQDHLVALVLLGELLGNH